MKKMRKFCLIGLLCALLPLSAVSAETSPLAVEELLSWRDVVFEGLDQDQAGEAVSEDVYVLETAFGTVEAISETLAGQSSDAILHIELCNDAIADPRGLRVGASVEEVLAAYPGAENAAQSGAFKLYAQDGEIMAWGWGMAADGVITTLQYVAAQPDPEVTGYALEIGLTYVFEQGKVTSIRVFGFSELIEQSEAEADFSSAGLEEGYTGEATPFAPEDLVFNGLNLMEATPGTIKETFGEPETDAFIEAEGLRVLGYSDMLFELGIASENEIVFGALLVNARTLPGPRDILVGDSLESVLARFTNDGEGDQLYGQQDGSAFGLVTHEEDGSVTVRYFIPSQAGVLSRDVMLHLSFQADTLVEYLIYTQDP